MLGIIGGTGLYAIEGAPCRCRARKALAVVTPDDALDERQRAWLAVLRA